MTQPSGWPLSTSEDEEREAFMEAVDKNLLKLKYIIEHKKDIVARDDMTRVMAVVDRIIGTVEDQLLTDTPDLSDRLVDDMSLVNSMIETYVNEVDDAVIDAEWCKMRDEINGIN